LKEKNVWGSEPWRFVKAVLKQNRLDGCKIIDICCGDFTDGDALYREGFVVDGIDASAESLAIANKKNCKVNLICSDVSSNWCNRNNMYDAACCMASYYLLDDPNGLIENLSKAVKPGGLFIFDFYNLDAYQDEQYYKSELLFPIRREVWGKIVANKRYVTYKYYFCEEDKFITEVEHVSTLYNIFEVSNILKPNFEIVDVFSDLTFGTVNYKEDLVVSVVARKI